jgi:hypothetical protein
VRHSWRPPDLRIDQEKFVEHAHRSPLHDPLAGCVQRRVKFDRPSIQQGERNGANDMAGTVGLAGFGRDLHFVAGILDLHDLLMEPHVRTRLVEGLLEHAGVASHWHRIDSGQRHCTTTSVLPRARIALKQTFGLVVLCTDRGQGNAAQLADAS